MKTIVALLKKDCRLHAFLLATYWLVLIAIIGLFYSASESTWHNYRGLGSLLQVLAWIFAAVIFAADSRSDPNSFWRTQPLSAFQLCLAKLLLVVLFIILPTVVLHWLFIERATQELQWLRALEPLNYFSIQVLCAALLGSNLRRSKPWLIAACMIAFIVLSFIPGWLRQYSAIGLVSFEGTSAIIISAGSTLLLLVSLWFTYLRRNITYQIPVAAVALLGGWLAVQITGPWFITPTPPQSKQISGQASQIVSTAQLKLHEWQYSYYLQASISAPRSNMQNYILSSRSHIWNQAGLSQYLVSRGGFDQGEYTFAHTQLGFAAEKDRRLRPATIDVAYIEQAKWNKAAHSPSTVDIKLAYSEPVVSVIADEPAMSSGEFSHQNHKFLLSSRILRNKTIAVSLKGYATTKFLPLGVIIYRPDLKELVHTIETSRALPKPVAILDRPKIDSIDSIWQPQFVPERDRISKKNSLGYSSLASHPSEEWLATARVMVYTINQTKPVIETLTLEKIELEALQNN